MAVKTEHRSQITGQALADLSLQHLLAELRGLDARIQRAVRLWQLAGQNPLDAFRGLYVADQEAQALAERAFGHNWGLSARLAPEEAAAFDAEIAQAQRDAAETQAHCAAQGFAPRFTRLAQVFGLERFDLDVLLVALAPAVDLRYERLYGYLQDDVTRKRPTINLALDLLSLPGSERLSALEQFTDTAPLFRHHILERVTDPSASHQPLLAQALVVDATLLHWLLGHASGSGNLQALQPAASRPEDQLLAGERVAPIFTEIAHPTGGGAPLIVFSGVDTAAQDAAARLVAARLGRPLLPARLLNPGEPPDECLERLRLALRDSRLMDALPYLRGWDLPVMKAEDEAIANTVLSDVLAEILAYPETILLGGQSPWRAVGFPRQRRLLHATFPVPATTQRIAIWKSQLNGNNPDLDLDTVAGQFRLSSGQIRDAVAAALDLALADRAPLDAGHLLSAARAQSSQLLSVLARKITPRYTPADIILPNDQVRLLGEIIATVRTRPQVLEAWGVGKKLVASSGVPILFAGPPGTGKTMAAEIIAAEIGLDLYKIDLSSVISKYIGETEKNLERIFHEADSSNAILFFDEADAIFGKRSEVRDSHDRYANVEISYLLQRMEAYDGVTILATNLRANLDEAFTRRLQFSVDFPFPEEPDRLRIWQTLFPPGVPRGDDIDLGFLAKRFRLAGGNIRNILVGAAYLAASGGGVLTMAHLLHSTRRELQKMGRLVGEEDLRMAPAGYDEDLESR
jgi:hypothetical protein